MTLWNTVVCILAITFWITNRQTQIKKSKSQQKVKKVKDDETFVPSDSEEELEFYFNDWSRLNERRHLVMSIDVDSDDNLETTSDDGGEDDEEEENPQEAAAAAEAGDEAVLLSDQGEIKLGSDYVKMKSALPPASPQRKMRHDLFKSISKLKVFSYLSDEAFLHCLNLMEYTTLPFKGMDLFTDEKPFDGSLFVVMDGEMELTCSLVGLSALGGSLEEKTMTLKVGPGDVLTSLLSTLSGLLEEYKKVNADAAANLPHQLCSTTTVVNVKAKASKDDTRLICIPPSALMVLLQSYPHDIHQIAHTVFARTQRVTIQTLVKNLGLGFDILYSHGSMTRSDDKEELKRLVAKILDSQKDVGKDVSAEENQKPVSVMQVSQDILDDLSRILASSLGSTLDEVIECIRKESSILTVKPGEIILKSNKKADYVYFLIDGAIDVQVDREQDIAVNSFQQDGINNTRSLHRLFPGDIMGEMSCFTDEVSFVTLRVVKEQAKAAMILQLPKEVYLSLVDKHSNILMQSIHKILTIDFSPLVHLFDWGIEWMHVQAGTLLVRKHNQCDRLHIILSGRLKEGGNSSNKSQFNKENEYGRGSCIGEAHVLLGAEYPNDVYAVRNSELAVLPKNVLEYIMHVFPSTAIHFAKQIASRQVLRQQKHRKQRATCAFAPVSQDADISIATIAVVPLTFESSTQDAHDLCRTISTALNKIAPCTLMTKSIARKAVGKQVFTLRNAVHELKMLKLLSDIEENHRLTVYQADQKFTWWTKLCIQQADCVLLVVDGHRVPSCEHLERYLIWAQERSLVRHVQLLVLQEVFCDGDQNEKRVCISQSLSAWIDQRCFVEGQHLVRKPIKKYENDVARMCRRITGMSLGLALGGGGARGLAHLGIIRALIERRVTVDICGGTSQGAFIGALFAKNPDSFEDLTEAARKMAEKMSSKRERLLDLTLPIVSYFNGDRFNKCIIDCVGATTRINELILNFFCVSTDLCRSAQVIHTKGLCWKYLRASMSLHGYLPPIAENGQLLVDGGYTNLIPGDIMIKQMNAKAVICVDVSKESVNDYYEYGTSLSGFWLLLNSLNPFSKTVRVLSMGDLSQKLIWVSCENRRSEVLNSADLFLTPPVSEYGVLDYDKFDEIVQKGYEYAIPRIDDFIKKNPWVVS